MIQFALLFALGFLTAIIIVLLVAPAIHRRIVRFAEDRLKATMPLSPQEVRAQKDAARAAYAAENARTQQALKRERDKGVSLMLANEKSLQEARRLSGENADLHAQLADMNVEATWPPSSSVTPAASSSAVSAISGLRSVSVTRAPRRVSSCAAATPLLAAPTTSTDLPLTLNSCVVIAVSTSSG